jgi:Fic family protein
MNKLDNYKGSNPENYERKLRLRLKLAKEKEYLDIKDVSVLSGFSISTIRRRIEEGVLKPIQEVPNGKLLFKRTNVEGWLNDGLQ